MIKRNTKTRRSQKGMAIMMVLFVVMVIAIIATGFIARSDAALQCGSNYAHHRQADYLAWAGLEHARALISSPDNETPLVGFSGTALQLDGSSEAYYDLEIDAPVVTAAADPNDSTYQYTVNSSAYYIHSGTIQARSQITGNLYYDPNSTECYYLSISRP